MRQKRRRRALERGVHNDWMRTHLHGLLAVALGKRIKLLTLPYIHLPPTITPIEPESLGEATLIFTAHLHPPATTIPTGNIISLHILCIQHNRVGECAEMCGCGRAQMFPSMHLRWRQARCKKIFKGGVKKICHLRGPALLVLSLLCQTEDKIFISHCFVSTLEERFCMVFSFFLHNTEGQSFPWSSAWHFSVHLFVCIRIWTCACATQRGR